jgi:uncharacterized membrane protein YebE (DUF533 family)
MAQPTSKPVPGPLDNSVLNMWRCVIAVAQADGAVDDEELYYFDTLLAHLSEQEEIDASWKQVLGEDLVQAQKIDKLLPKVTSQEDLHALFYFAGLMAQCDGELKPDEEDILRKIAAAAGDLEPAAVEKYLSEARRALKDHSFTDALHGSDIGTLSEFKAVLVAWYKKLGHKVGPPEEWLSPP